MKFLFLAVALIATHTVHAEFRKDLYDSVREEIQNYYSASGEWSVVKIKNVEEIMTDSSEFKLMKAKVSLQSLNHERGMTQSCLVTFINDNYEFYAINCF